jgi:hypothetical protein
MFFVKAASFVAWALFILGLARLASGFFVASIDDPAQRASATARYLGSGTSGDAIDQALVMIGIGIAFGVLAKIGRRSS